MFRSKADLCRSVAAVAVALSSSGPAMAQPQHADEFHRVLSHVDIRPIAVGAPGSIYDITVIWEVVAIRPLTATDMSTEVALILNGVEVAASTVPIPLGPNDPMPGFNTCGDSDPKGDGLCYGSCPPCGPGLSGVCGEKELPDPPTPPDPPPDCGPSDCDEPCPDGGDTGGLVPRIRTCVCTYAISTPFPGELLSVGDEVAVELRAATGAEAETFTGDDSLSFEVPVPLLASRVKRPVTSGCSPSCPADVSPAGGDGVVDVVDFLAVLASWGSCP